MKSFIIVMVLILAGISLHAGESVQNAESNGLENLLSDIKSGKAVEPQRIVTALKAYYAPLDKDADVAVTLRLTPVFVLLNNHYDTYKSIVISMYTDKSNHNLLRLPMLNVIKYHRDDATALNAVKAVFADQSDDSFVVAKSGELLAKMGIDISKEVEKRYPASTDDSKSLYAKILAHFKPGSSRAMIERDMDNETDGNKKIRLIRAFADTGIDDDYVINKLEDMLYNTLPKSHFHPVEQDIISVGIVMHIARSSRDDRFYRLIEIAGNNSLYFDTRRTALSKIYFGLQKNTTANKADIKIRLQKLSKDILANPKAFKDERYQNLLNDDVLQIINSL